MDFSEYRPYQAGDDLRSLDWKVYARSDRLYTKLYVPEQEETVYFLLDTSRSMQEKWPALQTLVMGLSHVILNQGDRVALAPLANSVQALSQGLPPTRGRSHLAHISNFLKKTQPDGFSSLSSAFEEQARRIKTRSHLIILSDFLQPDAGLPGLSQLRYRKHRLSLIQLLSPGELQPLQDFAPGEWELFDPELPKEDSESLRVELGHRSFQRYQNALQEHITSISEFAKKSGAVFIQASSAFDPLHFFSEDLRKAGLLY